MKRKCIQCNKIFTLTDSEINFYESKNLSLPKRCKQCREKNKASKTDYLKSNEKNTYKSYYKSKPFPKKAIIILCALLISLLYLSFKSNLTEYNLHLIFLWAVGTVAILLYHIKSKVYIQEFDTSLYKYTFYNTASMVQHYTKHGLQTQSKSMEEYLFKANRVITDKDNLSKRSKDDDFIYYNKKTKDFVVVAKAGYIRTYFTANYDYYKKQ